jgi:hypothetical protein
MSQLKPRPTMRRRIDPPTKARTSNCAALRDAASKVAAVNRGPPPFQCQGKQKAASTEPKTSGAEVRVFEAAE